MKKHYSEKEMSALTKNPATAVDGIVEQMRDAENGAAPVFIAKDTPKEKAVWWSTDKLGWPIETVAGQWFGNLTRIFCQNLRKVIG